MIEVEKFRNLLRANFELLESTSVSAKQSAETVELDQTRVGRVSRMDALQFQAMSQEAIRRREVEFKKIEAALDRIEAGTYGFCLVCDEEIAVGRLEIDPAGTLCIKCASEAERS